MNVPSRISASWAMLLFSAVLVVASWYCLGLAWSVDLGTLRGLEATPLVEDGVMYVTSAWSVVYALDGRTGRRIWTYDPRVPKDHAKFVCCDVVNRGVALYRGRVYVGALD